MAQPDSTSYRPNEPRNQSREEISRVLRFLFRKVDRLEADDLGRRHPFNQPKRIDLPDGGPEVEFPSLSTLVKEYVKRYPTQTHTYLVDRKILQDILDAPDSVGATIFYGIYPNYEVTLPFGQRLLWKLVYWLHQFLPREPRQLVFRALGPNLEDLPLHYNPNGSTPPSPPSSTPGIPPTKGSIPDAPGRRQYAFIPNILMGRDGLDDGADMTGTRP